MAKVQEKMQAQSLRRKGWSIKDIAQELSVSPGSVSAWCREIILTPSQTQLLKKKQVEKGNIGRQKGAEMNRLKKEQTIIKNDESAKKEIGNLSKRDLLLLGIGLYWGEGAKSKTSPAAIVNSDPEIIKIAQLWFQECLQICPDRFRPYIYISEVHISRKNTIVDFWVKTLNLNKNQFKIITLRDKPKKFYSNHENYYGVLALRVSKGTHTKYRIQSLIRAWIK